jgi:hypothetical protein
MLKRFIFLQLLKVPQIKNWYVRRRISAKRSWYKGRSLEDIFTSIYHQSSWAPENKNEGCFYSGPGSYGEPASEYVNWLVRFISDRNIESMVDLGCGDFAIGRRITKALPNLTYTGCDVVPFLIDHLQNTEATERIQFSHVNAVSSPIPKGSLITIRQVLQHLDNASIQKILAKLGGYEYIVITEHQLADRFIKKPNIDKPPGPDTRLREASSIFLNKDPFHLKVKEVLRVRQDSYTQEAHIVTYLVEKP